MPAFRKLAAAYSVPDLVTIRPGDLVVDIGANIGEFSVYAANAGARVIAIDPDPFTFERLRANTAGREVTLINKGLWEKPCTLRFNISSHNADGSFVNPSDTYVEIEADTLDNVLVDHPGRIRFIKADVEGAEPELLRGGIETLKRTEFIAVDCGAERQGQFTDKQCEALLRDTGFEIVGRIPTKRMQCWHAMCGSSQLLLDPHELLVAGNLMTGIPGGLQSTTRGQSSLI